MVWQLETEYIVLFEKILAAGENFPPDTATTKRKENAGIWS